MIRILGMGPGNKIYLTADALWHLKAATFVIGTKRQLETVKDDLSRTTVKAHYNGKLEALKNCVEEALLKEAEVVVLASGDPSIYGIAEWIKTQFGDEEVSIVPGISSMQLFFSRLGIPMHDVLITSVHGRTPNWELWQLVRKVCLFTDNVWTPVSIAKYLQSLGIDPLMHIGESLSYANECITSCKASQLPIRKYEFCVVVIDYER